MGRGLLLLRDISEGPEGRFLWIRQEEQSTSDTVDSFEDSERADTRAVWEGASGGSGIERYGYEFSMLCENDIDGFMKFSVQSRNGKESLVYDISGKKSLKELFLKKEIGYGELRIFFKGLSRAYGSLKEYLLDMSGLLLSPEDIFMDLIEKRIYFIYYPGFGAELSESMQKLADFIIRRTDHRDEQAVLDAYDFYKRIYAGDYSVEVFMGGSPVHERKEEERDLRETWQDKPNKGALAFSVQKGEEQGARHWESDLGEEGFKGGRNGDEGLRPKDDREEDCEEGTLEGKSEASLRKVCIICFSGLMLLMAGALYVFVYEPYYISRFIYSHVSGVMVTVAGIGSVMILMPAMAVNKAYKEKRLKEEGERTAPIQGKRQVHYLSEDRSGQTKSIIIGKLPFIIGKALDCEGIIESRAVSRHHAEICFEEGEYYIKDLGSTNGTFVGGREAEKGQPVKLNIGDELKFGDTTLFFF